MLQKRREQKVQSSGLDDGDHELLQQNRVERDEMTKEIQELRERSVSVYHVFFLYYRCRDGAFLNLLLVSEHLEVAP